MWIISNGMLLFTCSKQFILAMKHFLKEPWVRWEKWQMHKCKEKKKHHGHLKERMTFREMEMFRGLSGICVRSLRSYKILSNRKK